MRLVDAYWIPPNEIAAGDVMLYVVKAIVVEDGLYRLYRCPYEGPTDENSIPQGTRVLHEREIAREFFPSLTRVAQPDNR